MGFDRIFEPILCLRHLQIEIFKTLKQNSLNFTVPATETKFLEETTLDLTDLLSEWTDPWGVRDFTPTPVLFLETTNTTNTTIDPNQDQPNTAEDKADSDLDETDLDKIQADIKPKFTVNSEVWAMNRFHGNYSKRNITLAKVTD